MKSLVIFDSNYGNTQKIAEGALPQPFYVKGTEGPLFEGELKKARDWVESIKNQPK